jgi:hypothetical protein
MIYEKPIYYALFHFAMGVLAYDSSLVLWGFLAYQILQYVLNIRLFAVEWTIKQGNSWQHTGIKLAEFFAGYLLRATHETQFDFS